MQYTHGGDIYTYGEMIDFSVNINPLGPSKKSDRGGEKSAFAVSGISGL